MRLLRPDSDELASARIALEEFELSADPGGANAGDEDALAQTTALATWIARAEREYPVLTSAADADALEAALSELRYSTEGGGAHEDDDEVLSHVSRVEALTTKWGLADEVLDAPTESTPLSASLTEPRNR